MTTERGLRCPLGVTRPLLCSLCCSAPAFSGSRVCGTKATLHAVHGAEYRAGASRPGAIDRARMRSGLNGSSAASSNRTHELTGVAHTALTTIGAPDGDRFFGSTRKSSHGEHGADAADHADPAGGAGDAAIAPTSSAGRVRWKSIRHCSVPRSPNSTRRRLEPETCVRCVANADRSRSSGMDGDFL